nr:spore germination protein [Cohnella massiliensis]
MPMRLRKRRGKAPEPSETENKDEGSPEERQDRIGDRLEETVGRLQDKFGGNDDFVLCRFQVYGRIPAAMFYYSSMVDSTAVNEVILKPLMLGSPASEQEGGESGSLPHRLIDDILYHSGCTTEGRYSALVGAIVRGQTVIVVEGETEAIVVQTRSIDKRSIDTPATEQVIRGPREGFIEMLSTNMALLRYRLQTPEFHIQTMEIGRKTMSKVAVCYIEGVTNAELVKEVRDRVSRIDIDAVLDSGYLEQFIEDNHISPFPQVQYTERPDKVVANLLEGRVAILVDGSPLALVVPTVFSQFYQTVEDYTERFLLMSAVRMARFVALIFSLVFPSLYVAIISFNPELIPTEFAVAVAGGRAGVPFPAVIEVLVIEIAMEVLREATIRLPQQVGGALSIVGVLVVGQAAVAAGFVSPITVVIIALTTIGSFATPAFNVALALRLLRFPLIIMAGIFGLYGVMIGLILIANHLLSLKSFGVPYLSPLVPSDSSGLKDLLVRGPLWWMQKRPAFLRPKETDRVRPGLGKRIMAGTDNVLDPARQEKKER